MIVPYAGKGVAMIINGFEPGTRWPMINQRKKKKKEKGNGPLFGEDNKNSKLKASQVEKIKELLSYKWKQARIAKMFRVGPGAIGKIKRGESWK